MRSPEELNEEMNGLKGQPTELTDDEVQQVPGANNRESGPFYCDYKERGICGYEHHGECERVMSSRYYCW